MFWTVFISIYVIWMGWIINDLIDTAVDSGRGEEESENMFVDETGKLIESNKELV